MDEKVLLDWKEVHADIYSKFKQDLEAQLQKPYHETILELGDNEDVDSLQQAMTRGSDCLLTFLHECII